MLTAGTRLGPYEILSALGAGGMGVVYKARDTRLGRVVAIKVLAPHLADSPTRRLRFEREARAVSGLNHPHIAALHDVGNEDGTDFLVMEYIEGQTLAERLTKGALPVDEAVRYGIQIAGALDAAHRRGVVHRDLKPSNIMLTRPGVKLLDFGLAKLDEPGAGVVVDSGAPTKAKETLTEEGAILGTLQYMAPEQLEGRSVDARADLFALGGILYQMLTGRPPFQGRSQASLIAAILEHDPPPVSSIVPTGLPPLDRVIARCLDKNPDERWQSALDLENVLDWIAASAIESKLGRGTESPGWWNYATWAAAGALGVLLGAYLASDTPGPAAVIRTGIPLGSNRLARPEAWPTAAGPAVAISHDGATVAYVGERDGTTAIFLRGINATDARPLEGTEGAYEPFFSPDDGWLGFVSDDSMWRVPVGGGAPISMGRLGGVRGASWGADGYVYFTPNQSSGIWRVSESGGEAEELTAPDQKAREKSHRFPQLLPNGKAVLFTVGSADMDTFDGARIEVLDLETRRRRILVEGGSDARYLETGHVVYARAGALFAVRFDAERLEAARTPVSVLEGVAVSPYFGSAHFAVSANGLLVFAPGGNRAPKSRLVWVDRDGGPQAVSAFERPLNHPRISPDGGRILVQSGEANVSVWVHELSRGTWTRVAAGWDNQTPIWHPDGEHIAFNSNQDGRGSNLFRKALDGSEPEPLVRSDQTKILGSWSPDGSVLTFTVSLEDIWALSDRDVNPYPLLDSRAAETSPEVSPDGRFLAYVSDESGRREVYLQPFPGPGPRVTVSTEGGTEPAWSRSGEELFYRQGDKMMVVDVRGGRLPTVSRPRFLFDASRYRRRSDGLTREYGVTADTRFLMVEDMELEPMPDHLALIVNWFAELERLVPVD